MSPNLLPCLYCLFVVYLTIISIDCLKFCSQSSECNANQVCVSELCTCDLGYEDPNTPDICQPITCQNDTDCREKGLWQVCTDGRCQCRDGQSGTGCGQSWCEKQDNCTQENTFCLESYAYCACNKNYHYDFTTKKCERFECRTNEDCIVQKDTPSDRIGSECNNGQCVCGYGYKPAKELKNNLCHQTSETYHKPCNSSTDCFHWYIVREECVDGICQCGPDTRYNPDSGLCNLSDCQNSTDCRDYDQNRVCEDNSCKCRDDFYENSDNGKKCWVGPDTRGQSCAADNQCSRVNQRCLDKQCQCKAGYRYTTESGQKWCSFVDCRTDNLCGSGADSKRTCDKNSGKCVCDSGHREDESNGYKCVSSVGHLTPHNVASLILLAILATVILKN